MAKEGIKRNVLLQLFRECEEKNDFIFTNADVKRLAAEESNPFDFTKIDSISKLPKILVEKKLYCNSFRERAT